MSSSRRTRTSTTSSITSNRSRSRSPPSSLRASFANLPNPTLQSFQSSRPQQFRSHSESRTNSGLQTTTTTSCSTTMNERSPLLLHRTQSEDKVSSTQKVKRLSAAVSDLISGGSHSGTGRRRRTTSKRGAIDAQDSELEEEDRASLFSANGDPLFDDPGLESGKRRGVTIKGYDGDFKHDLEGEAGNGVRQWSVLFASDPTALGALTLALTSPMTSDNFVTIDWIHDTIKNSYRMRKLRRRKRTEGLRGLLINLWDGSQGWILVTLIGIVTALIAFMIISSEMLLFDLKDGYCLTNARLAKRFCCRPVEPIHRAQTISTVFSLASVTNIYAGRPKSSRTGQVEEENCPDWRSWGEVWIEHGGSETGAAIATYLAYIVIAVFFAVIASTMTLYLTASNSVYSSKDTVADSQPGVSVLDSPHPITRPLLSPSPTNYATLNRNPLDEPRIESDGKLLVPMPRPRKVMYFAAGSGIPEIKTILSGFTIRGYLGSWTLFTKSIGLSLSVASGLSLGKEGPLVHISSAVGNIASRFFPKYDRNEGKRREILSAACAAGVAVSFGAPVGGTLFSLEEVSYFFPPRTMIRSFWCAMIAAISLKMLDPFGTGKTVLFEVTYDRDWHTFELIGFLLLGVFGGVYGALFCKANIWWTRNVRNGTFLKSHPIVEVALVTLLTVAIAFYNPWTKMGGTELVSTLFSECHLDSKSPSPLCIDLPEQVWGLVASLFFALVAKAALTVITFGIKLPAGIFIPTLVVGACTGRIAGLLVELLHARHPTWAIFDACRTAAEDGPQPFGQACVLPGVWSMIGAVSALSGVTRTTVSLAVITFELTSTLNYTVPVMLGVVVAKTVGDAIEARSIYDLVIELNALPYLDAKLEYVHESKPGDILAEDAPVISLDDDNTIESLTAKLASLYAHGNGGGFPIVASEAGGHRMYGYIASKELEYGLSRSTIGARAPQTPCTFRVAAALKQGISIDASRASTPAGCDLSWLIDSAPVTVSLKSPMELCHELFAKLGVRYLIVVDEKGLYRGVIEKARYLAYLQWLEKKAHQK